MKGAAKSRASNMQIVDIAKVAHEVNRAYCQALGDTSQMPWEEAPQWQRKLTIRGVRFRLENPDAGPDCFHLKWLREKEAEGWKYGPVTDETKQEHSCLIPYDQLPVEHRAKDHIFKAVVEQLYWFAEGLS